MKKAKSILKRSDSLGTQTVIAHPRLDQKRRDKRPCSLMKIKTFAGRKSNKNNKVTKQTSCSSWLWYGPFTSMDMKIIEASFDLKVPETWPRT